MRKTTRLLALALLALPLPGRADYAPGTRVPAATAPNQGVVSASASPYLYDIFTYPYTVTGSPSDQTATFPGPLVVNPTKVAENGLVITLPVASSGYGVRVVQTNYSTGYAFYFNSYGGTFSVDYLGNVVCNALSFSGQLNFGDTLHYIKNNAGTLEIRASSDNILLGNPLVGSSVSAVPVTIKALSGQTADMMDFNTSTGTTSAKVAANFTATFPALLTAIKTVSANYTLTPTDTTVLVNGAYSVTLPAPAASLAGHSWTLKQIGAASNNVVGMIDGNAGGYTLAGQYAFVTIECDGTVFTVTAAGTSTGVSGAARSGVTFTNGMATSLAAANVRLARLAQFSLSATGNGGTGTQTLLAGGAWTRLVFDTQDALTTDPALASQYTLSTTRFISENVGKVYFFREDYTATPSATASGYLQFAFDTSLAGDGSSIKSTTNEYINAGLLGVSAMQNTSLLEFVTRSTASTAAGGNGGAVLLVRFVGTGSITLGNIVQDITDANVANN